MARKRKTHSDSPTESPTCSCLLLCDDVVILTAKDKHILQGVIGAIAVPQLPGSAGNFVAYVRLSNVYSQKTVNVRFSSAATDEILWEIRAELVSKKNPLEVHTLVARVPLFTVEHAGRYMLSAVYNGVPIAETPVQVVSMESPQ